MYPANESLAAVSNAIVCSRLLFASAIAEEDRESISTISWLDVAAVFILLLS